MTANEYRKVSDLKNWEKNPRNIKDKDFDRLKKQIQELGQYKPLLITDDGTVIGGNMRLRAYRDLGIDDVWVSVVEADTEEEKMRYALSDNDRAGFYDDDLLSSMQSEYPDFEWGDYAVDLNPPQTLDELFPEDIKEDEVPELSDEPAVSKLGEVYQLGRHRLMCGDSTKIEDVEKLMNGQKADMVFTDPPYNVNFKGANYNPRAKEWEGIKNDDMSTDEFYAFVRVVFENAIVCGTQAMPIYAWVVPMQDGFTVFNALKDCGVHIQSQIVWNKNTMVLGQADYQWKHEVCWYGYTEGTHHKWNGGRDKYSVWEISKDANSSYEHPTQKPVQLAHTAVTNSSDKDANVLDLFGGSGSTLIACEQLDRTCYMMELDPKYCDVIRKRYAKFIGKENEWESVSPKI